MLDADQLSLIEALASGQGLARDLGNRPGNICFPEYLAEQAKALAAEFPDLLKVSVLDEQQMADLGMNAFWLSARALLVLDVSLHLNIMRSLNRRRWC